MATLNPLKRIGSWACNSFSDREVVMVANLCVRVWRGSGWGGGVGALGSVQVYVRGKRAVSFLNF